MAIVGFFPKPEKSIEIVQLQGQQGETIDVASDLGFLVSKVEQVAKNW